MPVCSLGDNTTWDTAAPPAGSNVTFAGHLVSSQGGAAPATSSLVANLTSATFTGNDRRGTIALLVAAGGIVAGSSLATCTFKTPWSTTPKIFLIDETSNTIAAFVGFYIVSQSTGVSFVLGNSQALVAGTYTVGYIVEG